MGGLEVCKNRLLHYFGNEERVDVEPHPSSRIEALFYNTLINCTSLRDAAPHRCLRNYGPQNAGWCPSRSGILSKVVGGEGQVDIETRPFITGQCLIL